MMLFFTVLCSTVAVPALFLWRLYFIRMGELVPGTNGLLSQFASDHYPARNYDRFPSTLAAVAPPRRFHSHNDYEHEVPLYEALSYGAGSVEADVWLVGDELLVRTHPIQEPSGPFADRAPQVGHTEDELDPAKTLTSLYLQPLMNLIQAANVTAQPGGGLE